jgi:mitogen-activated protein kinase 1/3
MEKCLTFSPKRRIEVTEALAHPYLAVRPRPMSFYSHIR